MFDLQPVDPYETCLERFAWSLPERFNIAVACCDAHAEATPDAAAIFDFGDDGMRRSFSFGALADASNRLADALKAAGLKQGDRIAILLPQGREVAIAHMAAYKLGAIALPLAHVFRAEALDYRLRNAAAAALVTDAAGIEKYHRLCEAGAYPSLRAVMSVGGASGDVLDFWRAIETAQPGLVPADTHRDDPCLMIYTSGTTGQPKGTLHAMRVLLGHLPGFLFNHQPFDARDTLFWTPADWAWAGGLLNVLLPALFHGKPVLAWPFSKFDPDAALKLMRDHAVTHAFLPPTALRMLKSAKPGSFSGLGLRSLACAGEALGAGTYHWTKDRLGISADEFYGQTECNYVLGSSAQRGASRAGTTGKPLPGANLVIMAADGRICAAGEEGEIAIRRDHPSMFIEYWQAPEATAAKFRGDWMLTGDRAVMDADGYIAFIARDDDIITSSGYRIGPAEIEDCLLKHEAVALAAVVGKPDELRTEIVKAFIVLKAGHPASEVLVDEIQDFVRTRLSVYEYPREITFVESLPMTSTGKIMRKELRGR